MIRRFFDFWGPGIFTFTIGMLVHWLLQAIGVPTVTIMFAWRLL